MKKYKACAKVNIFLKITGKRGNYHEIFSRFMKLPYLYDELSFEPKKNALSRFVLYGDFGCETEQNTIYKAYTALLKETQSEALAKLIETHAIKVTKNIPSFAGLGGGSSDAATFLKMCNTTLDLGLSLHELARIGLHIGADIPFFIYDYNSANVSGIGEIVEKYEEEPLDIETLTPAIEVSTPMVYHCFRENFYKELSPEQYGQLSVTPSDEIMKNYSISEANDLFEPALQLYPELKNSYRKGWFFSGSGSTFFRVREGNANG
ncbi:MAG: 4-(cytidine 5'-diphospho)-2-C-methyl-D-erythritol kinase [Campylobacterales bacterium]|nr:4-(cytidine 5'-diphospho)-2-C-methyl-D-erythritol kinase [Campylobacterales bacterium]MBE0499581.1 4-(cytidine 5'-diphospho)-2-C-methyl-D-erythritol kinase [Campylobacterales bacterium]